MDVSVPEENVQVYRLLFAVENGLREFVIEALEAIAGPHWYKHRLPGDVLEDYRQGITAERNTPWTQLVPHHPIYYVDFPALRKIIEREDNWRDTFRSIFGRKEILQSTLSELEPIRNKVAHNRKVGPRDLEIVTAAHAKISEAVGAETFARLASRCTCFPGILARLADLQMEAGKLLAACLSYAPLHETPVWLSVRAAWWYDESYLGIDTSDVGRYFGLLEEYARLPRERGSGHEIEKWVKTCNIAKCHTKAVSVIGTILGR